MNVNLSTDFWQLMAALGGFCGFQWWLITKAAGASAEWVKLKESIAAITEDIVMVQKTTLDNEAVIKKIVDKITSLENRAMYRIEMLEAMKNLDKFCNQITGEMQVLISRNLHVDRTDFQADVIRRQQHMDERARS